MKCFMHPNVEANSVCKKCGKAMCVDCSSYSGHSGICPECRSQEFIAQRARLNAEASALFRKFIGLLLLAVAIAILAIVVAVSLTSYGLILLVGTAIFVIIAIVRFMSRQKIMTEIARLTGEINKIQAGMHRGTGRI